MAVTYSGKLFLLFLLLIFDFIAISKVYAEPISVYPNEQEHHVTATKPDTNVDLNVIMNRHQLQLEKLEDLVKNLSELVSRLESKFAKPIISVPYSDERNSVDLNKERVKFDNKKSECDRLVEESGNEGFESNVKDGDRVGAVSVTKHSLFWSERFQFVSAVKLDSKATCVNVLPFKDFEGMSKYFAVGDGQGRVYVFLRDGDVMLEFCTLSNSPVTAMLSYLSFYKNQSILVTGHENGVILVHRVWEVAQGEESSSLRMENVGKFSLPENEDGGSRITILEVHHVGRTRYILSTDESGKIRVFRENGTVYGLAVPTSRPLAFLKQRLLFLTEAGAGSLDLRTMKIRESECEGLNHSLAQNYVFDAIDRSKAYGFTSEGDLIHVFLLGDITNFKCRVRSKKKVEMDEPLALQAIKGYLLIINKEKAFVFNVSSHQHYVRAGGPRLLFSAGLDEIVASFLNYQPMDLDTQKRGVIPIIASDVEKLVILSLGSGYVGMYRSNLPVSKGEFNSIMWSSPVLFFILFLFGAWQFFANKKEALTSWGPDDPFSSGSATSGAPLGSVSNERLLTDPSMRNADIVDLRGSSGLRGPSRRFVAPSPSQYPGGTGGSYRPSPVDNNSRPLPVDPSFRGTSELKFRGSNIDSTGFPKRREPLYVNNQVVDDGDQ
ncbi:hypothetical protein LguiB_017213 [Lonicera macranthoides]